MSTGAECRFVEVSPGQWTYWLQDYPYGETDEGDTYGPFSSYRRAMDHLDNNHANPGGHSIRKHDQHKHEMETGEAWVPTGVEVRIRIDSLGPEPTRQDLMNLVRSLPDDHGAIDVLPRTGMVPNVTRCIVCGEGA